MRSGSLRESKQSEKRKLCGWAEWGREAKEREGKWVEGKGVKLTMLWASHVQWLGPHPLATGNWELCQCQSHMAASRTEEKVCVVCLVKHCHLSKEDRARRGKGEGWREVTENELTFWALHIAIKFCLAKILTCLCHIIRNRKQQARFPLFPPSSLPAATRHTLN